MMQLENHGPLIFIAEDDRNVLDLVLTRLSLAGYQTAYGRDGWEAVHGIRNTRPAAAILDVNMPGLDGFGVLRNLSGKASAPPFPVMMLTARNASEDVALAMALGARDFLVKPFNGEQLLARMARLLRVRQPAKVAPSHLML